MNNGADTSIRKQNQRKNKLKQAHWLIMVSLDRNMVGRRLNENDAWDALRQGFYDSGTIVKLPHRKIEILVYQGVPYILDPERDLVLDKHQTPRVYCREQSRRSRSNGEAKSLQTL